MFADFEYAMQKFSLGSPGEKEEKQCLENIFGNETARIMFGVNDT